MIKNIILLISVLLITSCAGGKKSTMDFNNKMSCVQNFSKEGGYFQGRSFSTHVTKKGIGKATAIKRIVQKLALDGYSVNNTDVNAGVINATQSITVRLNVILVGNSKNLNVKMSYQTIGGMIVSKKNVQAYFCEISKEVSK